MTEPRWQLVITASAERQLDRLPEKIAAAVVEFMLGAVGTCIPTILMAPRIIGKTSTYVYVAVWLLLASGGGWAITLL